jgi:VCBS repeat protein
LRFRSVAAVAVPAALLALPSTAPGATGDFVSAGRFSVGNTPFDIAVADFDGDGAPDAAVPNANALSVTVLLGDGDGTFTEAKGSPIAVGSNPEALAAADFNGDGDIDLAVSEYGSDAVAILRGAGDGTFTLRVTVGDVTSPFGIAAGNLNGDGDPDLAVGNYTQTTGGLTVLLGGGGVSFTAAQTSPETVGSYPTRVAIGNFDGTAGDVAVANSDSDNVSILLGAGAGDLTAAATSPEATGDGPFDLALANLNADANQDIAVADYSETSILLGSATADFALSTEAEGTQSVAAADLDGDTDTDLALLEGVDHAVLLLNNGSGNFTAAAPTIPVLSIANRIAAADTDGDGDQDLLTTGGNGGTYALTSLLNDEPDGDDDGIADVGDQCPAVPDPQGCPLLDREVHLRYVNRADAFKGRLISSEPGCQGPGEKVRLVRRRPSGDEVIGRTKTDAAGRFRIEHPGGRGKYVARALRSVVPTAGVCPETESPVVKLD